MLPEGFLWRAITTCLLILDYFLFATGNPSVSYSLLGGWFWISLLAAVTVVSSYAPPSFRGKGARPFYWLLSIVGIFSVVVFFASSYASNFAAARMEAQILFFVKDPASSTADVSSEERQLMMKLVDEKYDTKRETFIPTFRSMDYLLTMQNGDKYRLAIRMSWNETPVISLRRVNG